MKIPKIWTEPIQGYDPWHDSRDFTFDVKTAKRVCDFFPKHFRHGKGEFAGKPFILERWQKQIIGHLFGWKRKDGTRRYRKMFLYVPKKNGKTQLAAGIALIMLVADSEPGAEVYAASGDTDQAALIFEAGSYMVENDKMLDDNIEIRKGYRLMRFTATQSYWKVLSSEAKTKHGPNVHCLIFDELHVFTNDELIDTLQRGTINRRQPLTCYLTTADYAKPSPCNRLLSYAKKVRDGLIDDKHFMPVIYETDIDADWTKEETWKAANPNYGITVKRDYFAEAVKEAQEEPSKENSFKRLHLNIQTKQEKKWMQMQEWDASGQAINKEILFGKKCFASLDLSSVSDIVAACLYFPEYFAALLMFWVPEKTAKKKLEYEIWHKDGYIEIAKGQVIDYELVRAWLLEQRKTYNIQSVAYDPWNASQLALKLGDEDGFNMVEFRQGYKSMNEPTKELEKLVLQHKIVHFGNPVLRWMVANAQTSEDPAGNVKLVKPNKDSPEKIDGAVALVMGVGLSIAEKLQDDSVFDKDSKEFDKILKEVYGR